jgi:DNA-binding transcriptional ArsR family regulator
MPSDPSNSDTSRTISDLDSTVETQRQRLNTVTQETRFVLIQNILSHPKQLPSLKELSYVNPSKSQSTIREHLEILIEEGIVEERVLPDDSRQRDLPWRFFGLTEEGRALLSEAGLLRAEATLQDMYTRLDTTPEIDKYAQAPRPGQATE